MRWTVPLTLLFVVIGCDKSKTALPVADADAVLTQRVIAGLRPPLAVTGESPTRWTLADRMQHYHVPGVSIAIVDHGRIAWARGFGVKEAGGTDSVTPETMFQAGSISKPTFAVGLMRLVQDGRLDLDEDVNVKLTSWKVPENAFTRREKVTLRRILSHSAGLTVHGFPGYAADSAIPTVPQILNGEKPANTAAVRVDTFPGAISRYSGGGTTVAMLVVTDVTKQPFPEFMQTTVLSPSGMSHSTYRQPLPASFGAHAASGHTITGSVVPGKYHTYPEMSAAGLWTTPSDLAALAMELQRTYAGRSDRVINRATLSQMLTVQKPPFGIGYRLDGSGPDLEFAHRGDDEGFVAAFVAFADRAQGAFIMTNGQRGGSVIDELLPAIAEAYGWPHHKQREKAALARDSASLVPYAGVYRLALGGQSTIIDTVMLAHGTLLMRSGEAIDEVELLADGDTTFFARSDGTPVRFHRDRAKRVVGISISESISGTKIK